MTNQFLADLEAEGATILTAGENAWAFAKKELGLLSDIALKDIGTAITTVIGKAEAGASLEELETAVLNLLQAELTTILKGFASAALQALIVFAQAAL